MGYKERETETDRQTEDGPNRVRWDTVWTWAQQYECHSYTAPPKSKPGPSDCAWQNEAGQNDAGQ